MNHKEFEELLNKFFDGHITREELEQFELAKKDNPEFLELFNKYHKTFELTGELTYESNPEKDLWENIESEISSKPMKIEKLSENYISITSQSEGEHKKSLSPVNKSRRNYFFWGSATVLAFVLVLILTLMIKKSSTDFPNQTLGCLDCYWRVSDISGNVLISGKPAALADSITIGDWIETDEFSSALITIPELGEIFLEPGTRIRLIESDDKKKKIELEYGTINSNTTAAKSNLYVNSDKTTAIDLGGKFTFAVDKNGEGLIFVEDGSVKVVSDKRGSVVPSGQYCVVRTDFGPGTPYNFNASPEFKKALMQFDFYDGGRNAITAIMQNAQYTDLATLVNLIPIVEPVEKAAFVNKISKYAPPPKSVRLDSLKVLDLDNMNEWIIKIQKQVNEDVQKKVKSAVDNIKVYTFDKGQFETEMKWFSEDMKKHAEDMKKHAEEMQKLGEDLKVKTKVMTKTEVHEYMKELNKELQNMETFDNEEFQKEMEKLNIELQKEMENVRVEMEKVNDEIKSATKENVINELKKAEDELQREIDKAEGQEKEILIKTRDQLKEKREKMSDTPGTDE